jgi:hypothetical protein
MGPFHQVVDYLQRNAHAGPVVASIEFGYALGFEPGTFYDDVSLGAWSGIEPAIVVIEDRYREWLPNPRPGLPRAVHDAARKLKTRCAPELDNVYYTVYRCR